MFYQLIALDLDGTVLNSRKEIAPETLDAVRQVHAAGKTVVFDTGRAVTELSEEITLLPEVRYAIFASGAGIYDIRDRKTFGMRGLSRNLANRIMALVRGKDLMPQIVLGDRDIIQASHMENLGHYHMEQYRMLYEKAMTLVPDIFGFAESCRDVILKINLYHAVPEERTRTRELLSCPEIETVYSEVSSLECSSAGVNKGTGLLRLCTELRIPPEKCIAVGDAENDIPMFRAAGLGIAMGNAEEHVKAAADLVVRDLDHGGCAQAVQLLMSLTGKDRD